MANDGSSSDSGYWQTVSPTLLAGSLTRTHAHARPASKYEQRQVERLDAGGECRESDVRLLIHEAGRGRTQQPAEAVARVEETEGEMAPAFRQDAGHDRAEQHVLGHVADPPAPFRLRQLVRYRRLIEERARDAERLPKTLAWANIKLGAVAADILGASSRAMLAALVAGDDDPVALAGLARGALKAKHQRLVAAEGSGRSPPASRAGHPAAPR